GRILPVRRAGPGLVELCQGLPRRAFDELTDEHEATPLRLAALDAHVDPLGVGVLAGRPDADYGTHLDIVVHEDLQPPLRAVEHPARHGLVAERVVRDHDGNRLAANLVARFFQLERRGRVADFAGGRAFRVRTALGRL